MTIRIASSPAEFDAFRALADEYEESLPLELRHATWPAERVNVSAFYARPHAVFLAEQDGAVIGCVVLFVPSEPSLTNDVIVKKLYVTPRARTGGTGRALMSALIDEARKRGCSRVLLDTDAEQLPAAYNLYQRLGFREREPFGQVDYACSTFMELILSS